MVKTQQAVELARRQHQQPSSGRSDSEFGHHLLLSVSREHDVLLLTFLTAAIGVG